MSASSLTRIIQYYLLPTLAVAGLGVAGYASMRAAAVVVPQPPLDDPARAPFGHFVAGAGLVEANSENIAIGTNVAGVVSQLFVSIGSQVAKGDPLFLIDDRSARANAATLHAAEEVAAVQLANATTEFHFYESVDSANHGIISVEELDQRRYAMQTAQAQLELAKAQEEMAATQVDLLKVTAPVAGTILQLKVHLGEYAPTGTLVQPLIVMGNVTPLNIRTDIDENDAWRVRADADAVGFLRGNKTVKSHLHFVRFEPYVIPKVSLTGESTERVDTRVLQVIYSIDDPALPLYTGQQMDVYIEEAPAPALGHAAAPH